MAMYRDVERGLGVLEPVIHVFTGGFQLPFLTVLSRMTQYSEYTSGGVSPLPVLLLVAAVIYGLWSLRISHVRDEAGLAAKTTRSAAHS